MVSSESTKHEGRSFISSYRILDSRNRECVNVVRLTIVTAESIQNSKSMEPIVFVCFAKFINISV
jgi:hypothetical protein